MDQSFEWKDAFGFAFGGSFERIDFNPSCQIINEMLAATERAKLWGIAYMQDEVECAELKERIAELEKEKAELLVKILILEGRYES